MHNKGFELLKGNITQFRNEIQTQKRELLPLIKETFKEWFPEENINFKNHSLMTNVQNEENQTHKINLRSLRDDNVYSQGGSEDNSVRSWPHDNMSWRDRFVNSLLKQLSMKNISRSFTQRCTKYPRIEWD